MNEAPVAQQASGEAPDRFPWLGFFLTLLLLPFALVALAIGFVWFAMPPLVAPKEPVTVAEPAPPELLDRKVQEAVPKLLLGDEATITITETEAASLLAAGFADAEHLQIGAVKVEKGRVLLQVIVDPPIPTEVPARFGGPWAVNITLQTEYLPDGRVRAELTDLRLGRIPIPLLLVRAALARSELGTGPLDPLMLTAEANAGRAVAQSFEGQAHLKDWLFEDGQMTLVIAPGRRS